MIFDIHRFVKRLTGVGDPHRATKRQERTGPATKPRHVSGPPATESLDRGLFARSSE